MNQGQPTPNRRPEPDEAARRDTNDKSRGMQGGPDGKRHEGPEKAPHPQNERSGVGSPAKAPNINMDDPGTQRSETDPKHRPAQRG